MGLKLFLKLLFLFFHLIVRASKALYMGDGVNIPLKFMPTQLIDSCLAQYGADIGTDVKFKAPLTIYNAGVGSNQLYKNLTVGDKCWFGPELFLDLQDRIIIEDRVTIAMRVAILTHTDVAESPLKKERIPWSRSPVIIRSGAYVGAGTIILQGVEIGECAVIGAGSVVNSSIPAYSIAAGMPARVVRSFIE